MSHRFIRAPDLPDCLCEEKIAPPIKGLWILGAELPSLEPRVAVVGSRNATAYGLEMATALGAGLAAAGVVVVSGMARGIDAAAHRGALTVPDARSIAVLGGGVDRPYPATSRDIYSKILERGAVLSEMPMGADHRAENFLARNRIIAALSLGVVLVQADPRKSGALTTIRVARDLYREIFAVPGDARSILSQGPHEQMRTGAHVCTSADDVLEVLEIDIARARARVSPLPEGLGEDELALLSSLAQGPARAPELARRADRDALLAIRTLTRLELAGLARKERDGTYRRTR